MSTSDVASVSRTAVTSRLLLATLAGAFFFLVPMYWDGAWTVPFDIVVSSITDGLPGLVTYYTLAIILGALALTATAYTPLGARYTFVGAFRASWLMIALRLAGAVLALLIVTETGPPELLDPGVGGLMFGKLAAS
ncbi:MAG: YjiH family protein, partial [Actinophytocola sp.]|nr:YjiH family protein [Actinophytocola sp.]